MCITHALNKGPGDLHQVSVHEKQQQRIPEVGTEPGVQPTDEGIAVQAALWTHKMPGPGEAEFKPGMTNPDTLRDPDGVCHWDDGYHALKTEVTSASARGRSPGVDRADHARGSRGTCQAPGQSGREILTLGQSNLAPVSLTTRMNYQAGSRQKSISTYTPS